MTLRISVGFAIFTCLHRAASTFQIGREIIAQEEVRDPRPLPAIVISGSNKRWPAVGYIPCCSPNKMKGSVAFDGLLNFLRSGGRYIDTAKVYENEDIVGESIRSSGVPRDEILISTKVWVDEAPATNLAREWVATAVDSSLNTLGLDYVDLMLLHYGPAANLFERPDSSLTLEKDVELWRGLIDAKAAGKVGQIGVCLHTRKEIEHLTNATGEAPAVAMLWNHPFMPAEQVEYVSWLQSQNIAVIVYGALNWWYPHEGKEWPNEDGEAQLEAATRVASQRPPATPPQVIIRWSLDHDYILVTDMHEPRYVIEDLGYLEEPLTSEENGILDAAPKWSCHSTDAEQQLSGCAP